MAHLAISLLGPFQVKLDSRPVTEFESNKVRALLAYLAAEADQPHSRDALMGLLWPDQPDAQARNNLRHSLTILRQAIGDAQVDPPFLTITRDVQFNSVSDSWVDVAAFTSLLADCQQHAHLRAETCQSCAQRLAQAVELYQGDFLEQLFADSPDLEEWALVKREGLRYRALEAMHRLAAYHERRGEHEQAHGYAARQLELDPWCEEAHRQAMRALALGGQRSAALAQYEKCRRLLADELSAEPDQETMRLYEEIRSGDLVREDRRHNLPAHLSKFIGREQEIAQLKRQLDEHRLVTLTGSGGIGKTRLAIQVSREVLPLYPHGVWLIELAPLADPAFVPRAVMTTFALQEDARRSPLMVLTDYFREKTALLVLDNCEHVVDACAQLAHHLLTQCPDLRVLASSREALGIEGEAALRVPSLSLPPVNTSTRAALDQSEAAQLFLDRAAIALPGLALADANAPAIAQICRRLDGVALAIELAASRVKLLKVEQIAARLDDAFRLLTEGSRTALPRQQTLRATIDWSYNLLSEAERTLLRRLAVFAGGWTLEAAEAICSKNGLEAGDVLDLLGQLVNKSLVVAEGGQSQEPRYYMLETIRQYARAKLNDSGEGEAVRERHARWYMELAERAEPKLHGHGQIEWLDRMEQEHDNMRAALEWSLDNNVELGLQIANGLTWFWTLRGHTVEGYEQMEKLLAAGPLSSSTLHAKALTWAAWLAVPANHEERTAALVEASVNMSRQVGYREGLALSLLTSAILPYYHGDYDRALPLAEESLALFEEAGIKWGKRHALGPVGYIAQAQGNYERARAIYEESVALSREIGDIDGIGWSLYLLGNLALEQDHYEQAMTFYQESLPFSREIKSKGQIAWAIMGMGDAAIVLGRYAQARALLEEGLVLNRELGDYQEQALVLGRLGRVARLQGEYKQAEKLYAEGLQLAHKNDRRRTIARCLAGLAELAAIRDQPRKAARLLGAAEAMPELYINLWSYERRELEQISSTIHAQLDEATFRAEREAGRQIKLEDAIAYAPEEVSR